MLVFPLVRQLEDVVRKLIVYPFEMFPLCAKVTFPALDAVTCVDTEVTDMIHVLEWDLEERVLLLPHADTPTVIDHGRTVAMVKRDLRIATDRTPQLT